VVPGQFGPLQHEWRSPQRERKENPAKLDILQAIKLAVPAWKDDVKPVTIANCFRHCRIRNMRVPQEDATAAKDVAAEEDLMDKEVIKDLAGQAVPVSHPNGHSEPCQLSR
jgi:hypothetical protein